MYSLWDTLPTEIQQCIIETAAATLIQQVYRKTHNWYFRRLIAIRRKAPNYAGKNYRNSDRVLIIRKDNKLQYGTINSMRSNNKYFCRLILLNGKHLYYYKKDYNLYHPKDIVAIRLLSSWRVCFCKEANLFGTIKCDQCIIKGEG